MDSHSTSVTIDPAAPGLTELDSFLQIFCIFQGSCFFLFPGYLKDVGIIPGIFLACFITLAYLYLVQLYFWSESQLKKYDSSIENLTLTTLVEKVFICFGNSPRLGLYLKLYLKYEIILSWYLGMSFSLLFICKNFQLILRNYNYDVDIKTILLYLSVPLIFTCFISNLRVLNKAFYLSTVVIGVIVIETSFYIFTGNGPLPKMNLFGSVSDIPTYLNNIMFTIGITPLLFTYKNEMKYEGHFKSVFGSLNLATCLTILLSLIYSIACNVRFGEDVNENIIENLPNNYVINVSNMMITTTIIVSGGVVFYGTFEYLWHDGLEVLFGDSKFIKCWEYGTKLCIFIFILVVTSVIPSLATYLNLISSFSSPYDMIIVPVMLETVIVWKCSKNTFKKFVVLFKNSIITLITILFALWSFTGRTDSTSFLSELEL